MNRDVRITLATTAAGAAIGTALALLVQAGALSSTLASVALLVAGACAVAYGIVLYVRHADDWDHDGDPPTDHRPRGHDDR